MKKRIIASTMASVMAISTAATALVASADVKDVKTEAVTKSQLEKFIADKEIQDLLDGGLEKFGTKSGEKFMKAIDYANAVVEDGKATADEATVAYQMVKAAYNNLAQHTKEELQLLVSECTDDYRTENELNEYDKIYKDDEWNNFETAYITGDDCKDSDDILVTTDAYDELKDAHDALLKAKLDTITKSEFVKARQAYETALAREFEFQAWQRGKVSDSGTNYDGKTFAWGTLYQHIRSGKDELVTAYKDFDEKKITVTSNSQSIDAVKALNSAAKILKGFSSKLDSGSETSIMKLLREYNGQLVYTHKSDIAKDIIDGILAAENDSGDDIQFMLANGKWTDGDDASVDMTDKETYWNWVEGKNSKVISASLQVKLKNVKATVANGNTSTRDLYYVVSKDKGLNGTNYIMQIDTDDDTTADAWFTADKTLAGTEAARLNGTVKNLIKGGTITISDLISINSTDVCPAVEQPASAGAMGSALDNVSTQANTILGKLTAAKTAVDGASVATVSGDGTTEISNSDATTVIGLISAAEKAATELKAAVGTTSTGASQEGMTPTLVNGVTTKYTAFNEAFDALMANAAFTGLTGVADAAAVDGTIDDTLAGYFVDSPAGAFVSALNTYTTDYDTASDAAGDLWAMSSDKTHNAYDDGTTFDASKDLSYKYDLTNKSFTWGPYTSTNSSGSDITTASLQASIDQFEKFEAKNWSEIVLIDNINTIVEQVGVDMSNSRPKTQAWTMLYNYMKYALEDEFKASETDSYTLAQVEDLIKKAYERNELTANCDMFTISRVAMVKDRTGAVQWASNANNDKKAKKYTENYTEYNVVTSKAAANFNSTEMYTWLNGSYKQLGDELAAFKYSYAEIIADMAKIARAIDDGKLGADANKKLTKELEALSVALMDLGRDEAELKKSNVAEVSFTYKLFNDDDTMNLNNRLFTNNADFNGLATDVNASRSFTKETVKKNSWHQAAAKAYETLTKDYEAALKALETPKMTEDLNGSGKLDLGDVQELLKLVVNGKGEAAKHDFNGDKAVNMADVQFLLTKWVNS